MSDYPNKPGQVVGGEFEQIDENGYRISRATVEWYGFDNATANQASLDQLKAVLRQVGNWNEVKYGAPKKG